jgi:hypothetical protein
MRNGFIGLGRDAVQWPSDVGTATGPRGERLPGSLKPLVHRRFQPGEQNDASSCMRGPNIISPLPPCFAAAATHFPCRCLVPLRQLRNPISAARRRKKQAATHLPVITAAGRSRQRN